MTKRFSKAMMMLSVVCCTLVSINSFAQQKKFTPEERAKMSTDRMKTAVNLTDSQYTKVYDLNLKYAQKMKELRGASGTMDEKRDSFKGLRQEQQKELSTILSSDQMSAYKEMQRENRKNRGSRGNHGKG
jgi:hypothetical protein